MNDSTQKKTIRRLQIIEGHVRAVQRMLENDAYCIDVIRQISAVQSALNKVSQVVLEEHLSHCVTEAVRGDDAVQREKVLQEIAEVFAHANAK
jgi:CsoR family transcriptional regulator, copper-sensing transcriptional repressor